MELPRQKEEGEEEKRRKPTSYQLFLKTDDPNAKAKAKAKACALIPLDIQVLNCFYCKSIDCANCILSDDDGCYDAFYMVNFVYFAILGAYIIDGWGLSSSLFVLFLDFPFAIRY